MDNLKRYGFFIGLVILFGGLNLAILLSHMSRYFGFALIILGLAIIYFTREERPDILRPAAEKEVKEKEKARPQNLGQRFIYTLTLKGALKPYLFILGFLVLAVVIFFNMFIADEFLLGSNDYVMLLLAGALIAYNFVPARFNVERDFALIFITMLFLILVIPTTAYGLTTPVTPDSTSITDNTATSILLTSPTVALSR
ncbi:MAG: hypothetical protein KAS67_06295, partial [Thermoplasmata archaeon]|nr:hypothetical protein [Thermoplasmata archaeon]